VKDRLLCAVKDALGAGPLSGESPWQAGGAVVWQLRAGMNNALYHVEVDGGSYVCKLCVPDERRRAQREYGALSLLQASGIDIAPRPVFLDESCTTLPYPVVVYTWLEGEPLRLPLSQAQAAAWLDSLVRMHACTLRPPGDGGLPSAWSHWFDRRPYIQEQHELLDGYGRWLAGAFPEGDVLYGRLRWLVEKCESSLDDLPVELDAAHVPLCLCHPDQNLDNIIWGSDGIARWVDWEYSGWGDPALDVADIRWHASLDDLGDEMHAWIRSHYVPPAADPGFADRLVFWDCVLVTRWPLLTLRWLWSQYNGADRLRLAMAAVDSQEVYGHFLRRIQRGEDFYAAAFPGSLTRK
jgi:aminoglycoside phosphotransferase (APT) family kinase protein